MRLDESSTAAASKQNTETGSASFKLVFAGVFVIVIVCLGVSVYLASQADNMLTRSLQEKVLSVFTLGCGAIIGLLGGKTLK